MDKADQQIHKQFSEYGRNAREWMRKCVLLLPEIERRKIWRKARCGSIFEYAAKLAGMSRTAVEDGLRVMHKAEIFPALKAVVESRGVNRVRPVLGIVTPETQEFWAEKARIMPKNALETYVRNYRLESRTSTANEPVKAPVSLELSPELARRLEVAKKRPDFEERLAGFLELMDQEETPKAVRTSSRHIPVRIQRHVRERTSGLCAYPGCTRRATSLHHTQRWGLEKIHDPARLHGLCDGHERLAHLGLIENEEAAPRNWRVRKQADLNADKRFVDQFVALYRPT